MRITLDHNDEQIERICHVLEHPCHDGGESAGKAVVGIDEAYLAWFYIAPGQGRSQTSLRMLQLAKSLIGSSAWAVVQVGEDGDPELLRNAGLEVVESYRNQSDGASGVSVHIVQTIPTT